MSQLFKHVQNLLKKASGGTSARSWQPENPGGTVDLRLAPGDPAANLPLTEPNARTERSPEEQTEVVTDAVPTPPSGREPQADTAADDTKLAVEPLTEALKAEEPGQSSGAPRRAGRPRRTVTPKEPGSGEARSASFGSQASQATSPTALLELEQQHGRTAYFAPLDGLLGDLLVRAFQGERLAQLQPDRIAGNKLILARLPSEQRELLDDIFAVERQQARGAWFLPQEVSLKTGWMSLPALLREQPRFANSIAVDEKGKVTVAGQPDALFYWAVLEPLFMQLLVPFDLRGPHAGLKSADEQRAEWGKFEETIATLGFALEDELAVLGYGGGWHRLSAPEQLRQKQRLLEAMARQVRPEMAPRYRASQVRWLVARYYEKAVDGRALRKRVVDRALMPTVAAYFGGDWLRFLEYLGESPHPDEQVVTTLPTPRIFTGNAARAVEVATQLGIPQEEAARALAAFWGNAAGTSPIERRVGVLRHYWQVFDELHARQESGMTPLWGLIEDRSDLSLWEYRSGQDRSTVPYHPGLYLKLLPGSLLSEIEQLWGRCMLPRWPESIVTEPFPHYRLAETFGPAVRFWHGCGLTAWFIAEGPSSRTDLAGLANYYASELAALAALGTPVDDRMFSLLIAAERTLGPPKPGHVEQTTTDLGQGFSYTMSMQWGSKRGGWSKLREIVTAQRRAWAERYLAQYLHARWEAEVKEAQREYHVLLHEKGKPPTAKQFGRAAELATNHWFGGDTALLYAAMGEKCPVETTERQRMPDDKVGFGLAMLRILEKRIKMLNPEVVVPSDVTGPPRDGPPPYIDNRAERLAELVLRYIQLEEATGRPPTLNEFTTLKNDYYWSVLGSTPAKALQVYAAAVEQVRTGR